jgi:peptide-O-fucosyltransferase
MVNNRKKQFDLKTFAFEVFCYSAQVNEKSDKESCHAKDGNPFGPFWSHFNIDFDDDIFYRPLYFDIINPNGWNEK